MVSHVYWISSIIDWIFFSLHLTFDSISWLNHNKMINQHNHHHYYGIAKKGNTQKYWINMHACQIQCSSIHVKVLQSSWSWMSIVLILDLYTSTRIEMFWKGFLLMLLKVFVHLIFFPSFFWQMIYTLVAIKVHMKNQLAHTGSSLWTSSELQLWLPYFRGIFNLEFQNMQFFFEKHRRARRSCSQIHVASKQQQEREKNRTHRQFAVEHDACNT